jgi:hypothetical protein
MACPALKLDLLPFSENKEGSFWWNIPQKTFGPTARFNMNFTRATQRAGARSIYGQSVSETPRSNFLLLEIRNPN